LALAAVLLVSAMLFAVGSAIERSKEGTTPATANPSGATSAPAAAAEPGANGGSEQVPEARPAPEVANPARGQAHGEATPGEVPHVETGSGRSGSARRASAEPSAGEKAAQLRSESRRSPGIGSETGSGETAQERLGERHREAKLLGINPEALGLLVIALIVSVLLAAAVLFRPRRPVLIAIVGFGLLFAALDFREVLHQVDESRTSLAVIASVLVGLHVLVAMLAAAALRAERMSERRSSRDLRDAVAG
jgi:hypothetical protein